VIPFLANLPTCPVELQAYGAAHYGARRLSTAGHRGLVIAPQFAKPLVACDV
jgi:transposase